MPYWLQRQLRKAYSLKDIHQIRMLNDCWYLYQNSYNKGAARSER
ncbi:cortex morphogenetic protein CmpA [Bacillus horti]|uniref:Cortex morphogenetic protein CmpA n=1 Tax=Caldalkalibacillus horti TaxID=77523 RepID=A0ABT9W4V1_9BACI|nr:cortex morphogenetic protein CmpA [Bacillus horti]MDQ0168267.1 hypothetical protein [Bacillus horti]